METKLGEIVDDVLMMLYGYGLYHQFRNTKGAGVALFIHKSLPATRFCSSAGFWVGKPVLSQYLFCEIAPFTCPPIFILYYIVVVYRPLSA